MVSSNHSDEATEGLERGSLKSQEKGKTELDPIVSHILYVALEYFQENLAPNCEFSRSKAGKKECRISGEPCKDPWKCPRLDSGKENPGGEG